MTDTTIYIIIGIIVFIVIVSAITIVSLVKSKNRVDEAFATMDVYLKKRWDLIPNLVETVKGYAEHEKKTLEEVIRLRNTTYDNMDVNKKIAVGDELKPRLSKLIMLSHSYSELKVNEKFLKLSKNLEEIEIQIANSRACYSDIVRKYNDKIGKFPSNVIAKMFGFKERDNFEIDASREKAAK